MDGAQRLATLTRRAALRTIACTALASLGAACANLLQANPATPPASPVVRGGTLRVGVPGDVPSLDPHQLGGSVPTAIYPVWDRLVEYDSQVRPQPALAESWEMSPDGSRLSVRLRQGVEFHSGRELTSEDVKWTFTRLQTDPVVRATGFYSQVQPLSAADTIDKYTIVLKSDTPWPGIFGLLSLMNVVDSVSLQAPDAGTQAVGTGPFVFREWIPGDHIRLVKNQHYWQADRPYVDELLIRIYQDPQAMVSALEGGAIDVADRLPLSDATRLQADSRYRLVTSGVGGTRYALLFNAVSPPTDNRALRQAMLFAIDRRRVVDSVLRGFGAPQNLPFAMGSPAYDAAQDKRYSFDLAKAQSLIAASGIANPALDFNYSSVSAEWAAIGQIYQADLARIGVTLNLKPTDPVTLTASLRARTWNGLMTGIVPLGGIVPTQQAVDPYYSPVVSFSGFTSPELSQLSNELLHEVDPARQQGVYARWSDYVLDEAWAGVIATSTPMVATTARVRGLRYTQLEILDYRYAQLDG